MSNFDLFCSENHIALKEEFEEFLLNRLYDLDKIFLQELEEEYTLFHANTLVDLFGGTNA
ncbi:MAG TPA: hypothetical protein VJ583_03445 [Nitrososphaeraceae archaeon]|nr:hypothetical protein [Nitrososphaeraceae archaeon]